MGNRISAGKFITIYPGSEEKFVGLLKILYKVLKDVPEGPYILIDKQLGDSNIFYRYGAYKKILSDTGKLCIYDNMGTMIPDLREPHYVIPSFIEEPVELGALFKSIEPDKTPVTDVDNQLSKYKIVSAIRYSNSGGIYIANRKGDEFKCVIKEARPSIG